MPSGPPTEEYALLILGLEAYRAWALVPEVRAFLHEAAAPSRANPFVQGYFRWLFAAFAPMVTVPEPALRKALRALRDGWLEEWSRRGAPLPECSPYDFPNRALEAIEGWLDGGEAPSPRLPVWPLLRLEDLGAILALLPDAPSLLPSPWRLQQAGAQVDAGARRWILSAIMRRDAEMIGGSTPSAAVVLYHRYTWWTDDEYAQSFRVWVRHGDGWEDSQVPTPLSWAGIAEFDGFEHGCLLVARGHVFHLDRAPVSNEG